MMQKGPPTRTALPLIVAAMALGCSSASAAQATIPERYADTTFWRLSQELSEPNGYFRSDNLVSNETSFQWVAPSLAKMTRANGVYLGVAPEQNFTFIAALKPAVAFIVDIRRGNLIEHLMYKALFEISDNRVDFAFRLFGRRPLDGMPTATGIREVMDTLSTAPPDTAYARTVLNGIIDRLTKFHGFPLSAQDTQYIGYVYESFVRAGPRLRYNMGSGRAGFSYGRMNMPDYATLMTETDSLGVHRSFLASDEAYGTIREMQLRNVIIPLTGDFAGSRTLRTLGGYVRDHDAVIQAIYVSNVEQYLFQEPDGWRKYYDNVATLPVDSTTVFIRSASQGYNRQQSTNSRQNELLCPVKAHLEAYAAGKIRSYWDVFGYCR